MALEEPWTLVEDAQAGPRARPRPPRVTAAAGIYGALREAIVAMELTPGTALQEKALTLRFGVSRTPVREALLRLAEDGLVDIFPQSGTFVSRVPVAAIPEAVVIRQALEDVTVRRLAAAATPVEVARREAILARQVRLAEEGDARGFHEADEGFHEAIAAIVGLPGVWGLLKEVKVQIDRARRLTLPVSGRMSHVIGEHRVILDAIARHDVKAARAAMRSHLSAVIPDVARLSRHYPHFFA
jgi:GntR family transcriptional regulator, rspAB operon transcriptional repressor